MKTSLSDYRINKYLNNNYQLCPFNCCSCLIIECCSCCHCCSKTFSHQNNGNIPHSEAEHLIPIIDYNNKRRNNSFNDKQNIIQNNNKNNKDIKYINLKQNIKSNNLVHLNKDLFKETKNLKYEIQSLKEKLKNEKEYLQNILQNDYDILNDKIKKKNTIPKFDDNNEKNINNKNNTNYNNENKKKLKVIEIPKIIENGMINDNNYKSLNSGKNKKITNKKQFYINTNYDDIDEDDYIIKSYKENNNNKKEDEIKSYYYKNNMNKVNVNKSHFKSPSMYNIEKRKKIRYYKYPILSTESSILNRHPVKIDSNFKVHRFLHNNEKTNEILNTNYRLDTFRNINNLKNEFNSCLTEISTIREQKPLNQKFDYLYDLKKKHKLSKYKIPICFNDNIDEIKFPSNRHNMNISYDNHKRRNKISISPLNRNVPNFLSNSKNNVRDYQLRKFNFHSKYDNLYNNKYNTKYNNNNKYKIKQIELIGLKKNPLFYNKKNLKTGSLDNFQYNNNLFKSNSSNNTYKINNELNNRKIVKNKNSIYTKKKLQYLKINPNTIYRPVKFNKNINYTRNEYDDDDDDNYCNNKKLKTFDLNDNLINQNENLKRTIISPNKDIVQTRNKYLSKYQLKDNEQIKKKNSIPFIKMNNLLSNFKMKNNTNEYNNHQILKNIEKNKKTKEIDLEENLLINNKNKYNTDINNDNKTTSEESNRIISNDYYLNNKKKIKSKILSKMNIDTNLSIGDEIKKYYKLKSNMNIDISSKTIFTIYTISNRIFILCFDFNNKKFSFRDFADFGKFEENYKLSLKAKKTENNKNSGNLFLSKYPYLYIITGKNYDMLYVYDSLKKTINKLCSLQNNHSNGALMDFNNNLLCISGDYNKKVEYFSISKNEWRNYLSETLIERSNFPYCIIKQRYIFLLFGKHYPTNEYLNSIEYYDLNNNNLNQWKYLNFKNKNNLIKMNICNGYGINYENKKIIILGGYNGLEKKVEQFFIQLVLGDEDNFENNSYIEKTERKLKDIDKNKKYYFNEGGYILKENEINKNNYLISFDNELNCHVIQLSNLAHDVYYNFENDN